MQDSRQRLIVALDVSSAAAARTIVAAVGDSAFTYKVGMQLYTAEGPGVVRELVASGRRVFLDLKYHDIPKHGRRGGARGGPAPSQHADRARCRRRRDAARGREAAADQPASPLVLAVTVLTSLDDGDLNKLGVRGNVEGQVLRLAALALANGCKGIVASAREASALREELGLDFVIVTPGVRPAGSGRGDQVRVATPSEAIAAGATYIVVGRPITGAPDPDAEARAILGQIG